MHRSPAHAVRLSIAVGLLVLPALFVAGCTSALRNSLIPEPAGPPVQGLPQGYDPRTPRPPFTGPHPSTQDFDTSLFGLPVEIGDLGPIDYSLGALQYPFACETQGSGLGQPVVDNLDGAGIPVYAVDEHGRQTDTIVGYSKDCLIPTRVDYFYATATRKIRFKPLPEGDELPSDIHYLDIDGERVPFVVALERGTMNRFLYGIAMLADPSERGRADGRHWNGNLIYYFRGGVGIGKRQGRIGSRGTLGRRADELARGYALAFSTGNQTSVHYNMLVAANTASMVKAHFTALYGEPRHTIGIGESGGAVQQYVLAQNRPGLLDALIPIYGYPDMVTQAIWAMDCELLEYYFDVTAADQRRWRTQEERTLVMGLAASSDADNVINRIQRAAHLLNGRWPQVPRGGTECSVSWRGLTPVTNNPHYFHRARYYDKDIARIARFSHWHDLADVYGVDENGFAHRTYDNTGVQYGLNALRAGDLTPAEFLHLNANIGSWKAPSEMRQERLWFLSGKSLRQLSPWSHHNMQRTPRGPRNLKVFERGDVERVRVAPRNRAHAPAVDAVYRSGHVFVGEVDLPIIDLRHYLDHRLDMHHSFASFSARLRIHAARGNAENMLIWVADYPYNPTRRALRLIEEWLETGQKPAVARDACWDARGDLIAVGEDVWDGEWNGATRAGACMERFPIHQSPRNAAGAPLNGDLFQCALISVDEALTRGVYAPVDMSGHRAMLERIFPDGVCDYSQGDLARPDDLILRGARRPHSFAAGDTRG
jgi:hypothetical protein